MHFKKDIKGDGLDHDQSRLVCIRQKKRERCGRPQLTVKTSVPVCVYMVEEKGVEIENKKYKKNV